MFRTCDTGQGRITRETYRDTKTFRKSDVPTVPFETLRTPTLKQRLSTISPSSSNESIAGSAGSLDTKRPNLTNDTTGTL